MIPKHTYFFPLILIFSMIMGGVTGYFFHDTVPYLKPVGDIFLNLIFTIIVPLIFFNVSSAIARTGTAGKLGRLFSVMSIVFLITSVIAAALAVGVVVFFPPALNVNLAIDLSQYHMTDGFLNQIASLFTVPRFFLLFSHQHMLALIVFSILVGLAASSQENKKSHVFIHFLEAGEEIFMRVFSLIMLCAPLGFFAWFAVLVDELGPTLIHSYMRVTCIYYVFAMIYFFVMYTIYAYVAGQHKGIKLFWTHVFLPAVTAISTCSGAASIPANLLATRQMRVEPNIVETVIPLGAMLHKDGSVIGGMLKIAFLFGIFHLKFTGISVLITAMGVSLLVGTVMGAIPSGGMLGELLILTVYGFPPSALIVISAISIIIDPMATLLNVTGNSVSSMIIARFVDGKKWCHGFQT